MDTAYFKGNYPDRCSVQATLSGRPGDRTLIESAETWPFLLEQKKLEPDSAHVYAGNDLAALGPVDAVRLNIYPDGGVSRFRVFGTLAR